MRYLWTYFLCGLGTIAIYYLLKDSGTVIKDITLRDEIDGQVYIVEYKITRYEQKKTKTDQRAYKERIEENKYVLPGSRKSGIWNWSNRE